MDQRAGSTQAEKAGGGVRLQGPRRKSRAQQISFPYVTAIKANREIRPKKQDFYSPEEVPVLAARVSGGDMGGDGAIKRGR